MKSLSTSRASSTLTIDEHTFPPVSTLNDALRVDQLEEKEENYFSSQNFTLPELQSYSLPSADGGREAYLLLFACTIVETVLWGMPSAYGSFLQYYEVNGVDGDRSGSSLLPLVGSFSSGLMYLFGPPVSWLINPRPKWRVPAIRIGSAVCVLALLLSSFATTVSGILYVSPLKLDWLVFVYVQSWELLLTQGLLYSIGGSFACKITRTILFV